MGEDTAKSLGFSTQVVYQPKIKESSNGELETTGQDTELAVAALIDEGVDILLFAGGDGTARDIAALAGEATPIRRMFKMC